MTKKSGVSEIPVFFLLIRNLVFPFVSEWSQVRVSQREKCILDWKNYTKIDQLMEI